MKDFRDPPNAFRPAPFWFWNHELDAGELERQIMEMKAAGLGGFIMHARHGLQTPYLGRRWMELTEHCAAVARREKMWAWLYDEDNWPSGTVGMRLVREHPEFRMSQLHPSDEVDLAKGETIDREVALGDELWAVLAVPLRDGDVVPGKVRNITRRLKSGRLKYTAGRARERVMVVSRSYFRGGFAGACLDVLSRQACAWFIDQTHRRYAEHLKRHLGRGIKGIFTDEPAMCYTHLDRCVPYTDDLPKRFEKDHGQALVQVLPTLFHPAGDDTPKLRTAFHRTVTAMYREAFFKPIADWCREHGIRSIGHMLMDGEFADMVKQQGDYFAMAEHLDYGGTDTLFDITFAEPDVMNNHLATKFASSAAHLLEKERTMAEAFGVAGGWRLSLPRLKRLGDFQAAMGVNYFMPHAVYYSLAGFRKWECPPDESAHVSYWPFYRRFTDHLSRLCAALSGGRHVAPVALVAPITAMAAALNPRQEPVWYKQGLAPGVNPEARAIHDTFEATAEALSRHQLDFDIMNEGLLSRGRVYDEGRLAIRGRKGRVLERFRVLVLPAARTLSRETADRLEAWAAAGLPIVFVDGLPEASPEQGRDDPLARRIGRLLKRDTVLESSVAGGTLIDDLRTLIAGDVDVGDNRDLVYMMTDRENRRLVFLANTSRDRGYERVGVRLRAEGAPHLMNTATGELRHLPPVAQADGWTELELDFPPGGSSLLMFARRRATRETVPPRMANIEGSRTVLGDLWQFEPEGGNIFPLNQWTLDIGHNPDAPAWAGSEPFGAGRQEFRCRFHAAISPGRAVLLGDGLFDQPRHTSAVRPEVRVWLNDHELSEWTEGTHYDRHVPEADVGRLIRQGMNELVVRCEHSSTPGLSLDATLYLAGDFTVAGQGRNEVLSVGRGTVHTGSWAEQGFPYFSGVGRYEQEFELPAELARRRCWLEFERVADVVEVELNGHAVGQLPWAPWSIEATDHLRPGRNRIVLRVANSMANLFRLEPAPSGLLGAVTLVAKRPVEGEAG